MEETTKKLKTGKFKQKFARFIFRITGWELRGKHPGVDKCVFIAAPHISNWDLPWMLLTAMCLELPVYFMMKDTAFVGPLGILWRKMGGIPVDRTKPAMLVENIAKEFEKHETMYLVIAPEGTRKPVKYWKNGFYRIAWEANVPICMAYMSYRDKFTGVGDLLYPTGNYAEDFQAFKKFYPENAGYDPDYDPNRLPDLSKSKNKAK